MKWASFDLGLRHFAVAVLESTGPEAAVPWTLADWQVLSLDDRGRWQEGALALWKWLSEGGALSGCDAVLVEQQHSRAPKNVALAHCLWSFCVALGLPPPVSVSPRKKFGPSGGAPPSYAERKAASVRWVEERRHLLSALHRELWDSVRKRDDLADALMQGVVCAPPPPRRSTGERIFDETALSVVGTLTGRAAAEERKKQRKKDTLSHGHQGTLQFSQGQRRGPRDGASRVVR